MSSWFLSLNKLSARPAAGAGVMGSGCVRTPHRLRQHCQSAPLSIYFARERDRSSRCAGAGRVRIIRQLLTESLVLSFAGGIAGVVLAAWGIRMLSTIVPNNFPRREEIALDGWVLGFTLLISLLTGVSLRARSSPAINKDGSH